jgi:hypothetical protein
MNDKNNVIPLKQPIFMIYDISTDEKIPLTQERLDKLIDTERQYGKVINAIRDMHNDFCETRGFRPKRQFECCEGLVTTAGFQSR